MKKILLTGANGFIGKHVLRLLSSQDEVHALTTRNLLQRDASVHWHKIDLLDPRASSQLIQTIQPTHCIHLAWYNEPGKFWEAPENHLWLEASLHFMRTFFAYGGERFIGTGTCAEYAWENGEEALEEERSPLEPKTLYGRSKLKLYRALERENRSFSWGRVFFPYGTGQDKERFIPSVIHALREGRKAVCRSPHVARDYLYVTDVARAFARLLESSVEGPVNIGSGKGYYLKEICAEIEKQIGTENQIAFPDVLSTEPARIVANTKRLSEVGISPEVSLSQGVHQLIAACSNVLS